MTEDGYQCKLFAFYSFLDVGKIASIDRGWLLDTSILIPYAILVGKIASIDRGWLHISPGGETVAALVGGKNSLD